MTPYYSDDQTTLYHGDAHPGPCCPCALPTGTLLALGAIASTSHVAGGPKLAEAAFRAARQAPRPDTGTEADDA